MGFPPEDNDRIQELKAAFNNCTVRCIDKVPAKVLADDELLPYLEAANHWTTGGETLHDALGIYDIDPNQIGTYYYVAYSTIMSYVVKEAAGMNPR